MLTLGPLQIQMREALLILCQEIHRIYFETTRRGNVILEIDIVHIPGIGIMLILEIDDQGLGKDSQNLGTKSLENEDQNQEKGQNQEREGNIRIKYITMYRSGIYCSY